MTKSDPKNTTILVIEDSQTQALHLKHLLEGVGINVVLAQDGREGIKLAQQTSPDLIVLDIQMPELNGFQVCMTLKDDPDTTSIPVVIMTSSTKELFEVFGKHLGAVDYIVKDPFADKILLTMLGEMSLIPQ